MRRSWARLALATAALLALAGLAMPALTSQAELPCDLTAKVEAALTASAAGPEQATVVELPIACQISQLAVLEPLEDLPYTTWVKLTGQRILREASYTGPMIQLAAGFGLILDNIEINGAGSGVADLAPSAVLINVQRDAQLVLDEGARLVENRSRAVTSAGLVTLRGSTAVIANNRLTVRPGEAVPGGAGVVNSPSGVLTMAAGAIRDNTVISTGQAIGGPNQAAPSVIGAGLLNLGQATISGGAISGNGFELEGGARSYGGGLATAYDSQSGRCGQIDLIGSGDSVVLRGNSASHGGAIALLGNGAASRSSISLANVSVESNRATTAAGAIYVADGVLSLADDAVIGLVANTIAAGGVGAGVVNASGEVRLSGRVRFANGNGLTADSAELAPLVVGALTGGTGSLPLESIPYFSQAGSTGHVVVARAGGSLSRLDATDLAAFSQPDPVRELVLVADGALTDAVVEARWRAFAINYYGLEASETAPEPITFFAYSADITLKPGPSRPGQRFISWADSAALTTAVTKIVSGTGHDVDLWADYRPTVQVRYAAGGEPVSQLPTDDFGYLPGETATALPAAVAAAPVRPGYTFLNWRSAQGTTYDPGQAFMVPTDGTVLTALWQPITYRIDYHGSAGTNPTSFTVESDSIVLVDPPAVSGFSFGGWFTAANGAGQRVTQIAAGTIGSISLWAHFVPDAVEQPSATPTTAPPTKAPPTKAPPTTQPPTTAPPTAPPSSRPPLSQTPTAAVASTPVVTPNASTTSAEATTKVTEKTSATPKPTISADPSLAYTPGQPSTTATSPATQAPPTPTELTPSELSPPESPIGAPLATPAPTQTAAANSSPSPTDSTAALDGTTSPPAAGKGVDTRQVAGWTLVASGTVGLAAMGTYWIRRLRLPRVR